MKKQMLKETPLPHPAFELPFLSPLVTRVQRGMNIKQTDQEDFLGTSGTTTEPMARQAATESQAAFPVDLIRSL